MQNLKPLVVFYCFKPIKSVILDCPNGMLRRKISRYTVLILTNNEIFSLVYRGSRKCGLFTLPVNLTGSSTLNGRYV